MTVDERRRHELHERLDQVLDAGHADTLMELLPPVGWADVATNRDLDALEARMQAGFAGVRAEVAGVRAELTAFQGELRAELTTFQGELRAELAAFRGEVRAELAESRGEFRAELQRELRHQLWAILGVLLVALVISEALGRMA